MTIHDVWSSLLPFLVLIPAAFFCYLPMKNQLRYPGWRIFAVLAAAFVAVAGLCAVTVYFWGTDYFNLRYSLALMVCFLIYWRTNTAGFGKSLFIFISACCLISYIEVIAYLLEALSKPDGYPEAASPLATAYELGLCFFFGALFAYPARKNLSWMIDNISKPGGNRICLTNPWSALPLSASPAAPLPSSTAPPTASSRPPWRPSASPPSTAPTTASAACWMTSS